MLFACYRRGDANDPERYVAAIAAVLALYDPELIRRVTDPRTGISTDDRYVDFMPNSGQLKAFCDAEAERMERLRRIADRPRFMHLPPPRSTAPGRLANVLVVRGAPGYDKCVERAQQAPAAEWKADPQGIWVPLGWLDGIPPRRPFERAPPPAQEGAQ